MSWQLVNLGAVAARPWRNGGGVTRELAVWPAEGDDWTWRMAVAEVAQDGPFSCFPGVDRWFAVLAGDGVRLAIAGQAHALTQRSAPLRFAGEAATDCRLLGGATHDFNLMLRRDRADGTLRRISGSLEVVIAAPKTIAVYAVDAPAYIDDGQRAELALPPGCLAWQTVKAGTALQLRAPSALLIEITRSAIADPVFESELR